MGAQWAKNEVTAAKRRCSLLVVMADGSFSPRGTDFMALGYVYICGATAPHFAVALGTMTNQRIPLVHPDKVVETVDTGTDALEIGAHDYETGDGPFVSDEAMGSNPPGIEFWIIVDDSSHVGLATSLADAYAGTRVAMSGTEDGATLSDTPDTERGLDGHFEYEATQAETNHDGPETIVMVHSPDSGDYDRDVGAGAWTTVAMLSTASDWGSVELENGLTRDDGLRIILRTNAAKFSKTGNDYVYRDMADTKDSHHGTVTSSGRIDADIDDPT